MSHLPVRLKPIPLLHERWDKKALEAKEREGRRAYDRGFRMRAHSDEELTFPDFEKNYSFGVSLAEIQHNTWPAFTGVDLSSKKRRGNAIYTVKIDPATRRRFPIDIRSGLWRSHETADQIAQVNALYHPLVIMVEDNAYQEALIDWCQSMKIKNDFWMKLEPTTTGKNKMDPELGLPSIQIEYEKRAWIIPRDLYENHDLGHECAWCTWDREVRSHPNGVSSDCVMAQWFARQGIETFGYGLTGEGLPNLGSR